MAIYINIEIAVDTANNVPFIGLGDSSSTSVNFALPLESKSIVVGMFVRFVRVFNSSVLILQS